MKPPVQAAIIAALLLIWMGLGVFKPEVDTSSHDVFSAPAIKSVRVLTSQAHLFSPPLRAYASTFANRHVPVTSRTTAVVADLAVERGSEVAAGDLLCQLEEEDRYTALTEAQAALRAAHVDWKAVTELQSNNLSSEMDIARKNSALNSARAAVERAELQLEYTSITAPFSGIVDDIPTEIGSLLVPGATCALLLDLNPILVRGHIAESDVEDIEQGAPVEVHLITGQSASGNLHFVARSADEKSHTFRVEAHIPNHNYTIRHGLSADLLIHTRSRPAHIIPASSLMLDAEEGLIVKILDNDDIVQQLPVSILYDSNEGIWVSGLPATARVITVGHYYVSDGMMVEGHEGTASSQLATSPSNSTQSP